MSARPSSSAFPALLVAILTAILLVGCGGDKRRGEAEGGESTTTRPSAVSEPETSPEPPPGPVRVAKVTDPVRRAYVGRVDAVCRRIDPERAKEQKRVGSAADPIEAARTYEGTIALGWRELRKIEAISQPSGEKALLKANVFEPIRTQLTLRERMKKALAVAAVPQLRRLRSELDNSTRALTGFARGYGFRVCGEE